MNKQQIFKCSADYERFITTLRVRTQEENRCVIYAYCLFGNHVHLLMQENNETIGGTMKRIASSYVYYYNHKYDRVGHLFQVRFRSQRQLSFIGKNTLDIYILHYFLISSINLTMVGQWFNDTNNGLMATVLAIIIAVHVTYIAIYAGKFLRKSKFLNDFAFGNIFRKK